jgi:hypothetical protein
MLLSSAKLEQLRTAARINSFGPSVQSAHAFRSPNFHSIEAPAPKGLIGVATL